MKKKTEESEPILVDLLTRDGEVISLQIPAAYEDEGLAYLHESIRRGDRWSTERFDGCRAEYRGVSISSVNCAQVVGIL